MDKNHLKTLFEKHYGGGRNVDYTFCPYRICPLGAHVDHQHGLVSGFAINYGVGVCFSTNDNGLIRIISHNFETEKVFELSGDLKKFGDWADYFRGVISVLQRSFNLKTGIDVYMYGELPIGGLSSSAASIIAFLLAIGKANGLNFSSQEIIRNAYLAEADFVGMNIGTLDQSCEVLAQKNRLLVLDTNTGEYEAVAMEKPCKPFEFLIVHSGAQRFLASSSFNIRVDECKAAAFIVNCHTGANKTFKDSYLRDIDRDTLHDCIDIIPKNFYKRAMHFYTENERVRLGKLAWQNGDVEAFGQLINESGLSSVNQYESGSELLIDLCDILRAADGVYGTRFLGGGFNGACFALIDPNKRQNILSKIKKEYAERHPEYAEKVQCFIACSEDGVGNK